MEPVARNSVLSIVFLFGLAVLTSGISHAQMVVGYDNFDGQTVINGDKWFGNEQSGGTDIIRRTENGQLTLAFAAWSNTDSNVGRVNLRNRLFFKATAVDLPAVTTVVFDGTIDALIAQDCADNPTASDAELRWIREFFNDGSSTGPNDTTGNIGAVMRMRGFSDGTNTIDTILYRCTNADCSQSVDFHFQSFVTQWNLGQKEVLAVRWEPENDQFTFAVNPSSPDQELIMASYSGFNDSAPPVGEFMYIGNRVRVPNCVAGRKLAAILSGVDNVRLNPNAILPVRAE